jgi:ribonuclease E
MTALLFQAPEPVIPPPRRPDADSSAAPAEPEVQAPSKAQGDAPASSGKKTRGSKKDQPAEAAPPSEAPEAASPSAEGAGEPSGEEGGGKSRRRGGRGKGGKGRTRSDGVSEQAEGEASSSTSQTVEEVDESGTHRRRRRRRGERTGEAADQVTALTGSTRLEAKRQRRREGRDAGRRRPVITEAEFLARRESVNRIMVVRELDGRTQIAVMEDGVLVEHYLSRHAQSTMVGDVYLGRVHNVLPSMEAAFVDIGKTRNAVLYAGEVNWDAAGMQGQPRRIEDALKPGDAVLVQVTKDPIGHKGARLTSQVTLAGRHMVLVPGGGMTGISRKLPEVERARLKKLLKKIVPEGAGVIVRTAAEGASEAELTADMARLTDRWSQIEAKSGTAHAPALLKGEPDIAIRVIRDVFNEDFTSLVVQGQGAWRQISSYIGEIAPDLAARMEQWAGPEDVFAQYRIDEQLAKAMDRKVWLPSGGSLVIDRTEAMTVVDVNTGKFTGSGGTLEETVTRNNLEAAEEIVRQLRLRDIGGIIVIDFIDMVLESNRDLVLRRLVECLGRDRTRHQVAEVTSLGLVQMTRKRVGQGLVEAFSEVCETCHGRGYIVTADAEGVPEPKRGGGSGAGAGGSGGSGSGSGHGHGNGPQNQPERERQGKSKRGRGTKKKNKEPAILSVPDVAEAPPEVKATLASIAAAASHQHQAEVAAAAAAAHPGTEGTDGDKGGHAPSGGGSDSAAGGTAGAPGASGASDTGPSGEDSASASATTPPKRTRRKATAPAGPPPSS